MNKKNKILVVGSIAFDHVMKYDGVFDKLIVPGNANLTVTASDHKINHGGCGANVCYSLGLHGEQAILLTCAGYDIGEYKTALESYGIDMSGVYYAEDTTTASAFIVSDSNNNQITIFEPGAMHSNADKVSLNNVDSHEVGWALIAPDHPERMAKIADECTRSQIPYLFDPSQQMNVFKKDELERLAKQAAILIVNEYESKLMQKMLSISSDQLYKMAGVYIETRGENGGLIYDQGRVTEFESVIPITVNDPTGCGDSFRAGLLTGLVRGYDLVKSCKMGALTATYSIEFPATQMHSFRPDAFAERFRKSYGEDV